LDIGIVGCSHGLFAQDLAERGDEIEVFPGRGEVCRVKDHAVSNRPGKADADAMESTGEFCKTTNGLEYARRSLSFRRREPHAFSHRLSDFIHDHGLDPCAADIDHQRFNGFMMRMRHFSRFARSRGVGRRMRLVSIPR
jgi:hypothetical protein